MTKNYNVEKIEVSYKPINLSFEEITLLSKEEYLKNEGLIPLSEKDWWLRTPSYYKCAVACVRGGSGIMYPFGYPVDVAIGVRPALKIHDCNDLIPGDKIRITGHVFTVLAGNLALCDTCIGKGIFDDDPFGPNSDDFETSYIKKYLYDWAQKNNIAFENS